MAKNGLEPATYINFVIFMALQIGIVGLPNVGKSTLFNALTRSKGAAVANYPFCTIDPNVGVVEVPDDRLQKLDTIVHTKKIIPAVIEFVDIAGLVAGASKGEGLGNQFLSHIRNCDAIAQVIRVFTDGDVIHVHGGVDPKRDREVIESELILADLQTVEKRLGKAQSEAKSGSKEKVHYSALLEKVQGMLNTGTVLSQAGLTQEEKAGLYDLHLLSMKPLLYIANVSDTDLTKINPGVVAEKIGIQNADSVIAISAKVEEELGGFSFAEAKEYLAELGMKESGLHRLIKAAYAVLGLRTYFTAGPEEIRAWTIPVGATAPQAAGVIHTDFEKGFIRAEVIGYSDYIACGGEGGAKTQGKLRLEGKEYVVQDGDVMHFRFAN